MTRQDQDALKTSDHSALEGCRRFWNLHHHLSRRVVFPVEVEKEIQETLDYIAPIIEGGTQ